MDIYTRVMTGFVMVLPLLAFTVWLYSHWFANDIRTWLRIKKSEEIAEQNIIIIEELIGKNKNMKGERNV